MNLARRISTWISVGLAFALLMPVTEAQAQVFHQIGLLTANAGTVEITPGPPGSNTVWFTERSVNKIGRFDLSSGTVAEFTIPTTAPVDPVTNPTGSSRPEFITVGPDGALWFTEGAGNKIGRITTAGIITNEFVIPTLNAHPLGITAGPDGNLWFTEESLPLPNPNTPKIGRITPGGVITEFPLPAGSLPQVIVAGPVSDGNLWFTEFGTSRIGRIAPGTVNTITEFFAGITANSGPLSIVLGPDGNLWFTEQSANQIGRITTAGMVTEISIPTGNSQPFGIAVGPDHDIWFTEGNGAKVGHVNTASLVPTEVPKTSGTIAGQQFGLTTGPDNFLWFADDTRLSTTDPNFLATPTIIVTSTPNPSTAGTSVTFAAAVGANNGTVGVIATGTVSFLIDLTPSSALTLSGNTAAISTAGLGVGSHNISAVYSGDPSFKPGTSSVFVQTVNGASGGGGGGGGCTLNPAGQPDAGLVLLLLGSLAYLVRRRTRC